MIRDFNELWSWSAATAGWSIFKMTGECDLFSFNPTLFNFLADVLHAGYYSLVLDGKALDAKRMVSVN